MPALHKNGISRRRLHIQRFSLLSKVSNLKKMRLALKKVGLYISLLKYLKIPVWQNQHRNSPKPDAANRNLKIMDGFIHDAFESAGKHGDRCVEHYIHQLNLESRYSCLLYLHYTWCNILPLHILHVHSCSLDLKQTSFL